MEAHDKGEVLTGVFYINTTKPNFVDLLNIMDTPLAHLPPEVVRPPKRVLDEVMESLR
jgi:2-oxoglutarate ferredoxin oxidoreductase subunit beta